MLVLAFFLVSAKMPFSQVSTAVAKHSAVGLAIISKRPNISCQRPEALRFSRPAWTLEKPLYSDSTPYPKSLHHSTQQKHDLVSTITPAFDWTLQLNAWQAVSVEAKAASHSASRSRKMERRVDVKVERSCTANCHWMDLLQALMVLL